MRFVFAQNKFTGLRPPNTGAGPRCENAQLDTRVVSPTLDSSPPRKIPHDFAGAAAAAAGDLTSALPGRRSTHRGYLPCMADEPSDACSRTNEDDAMASRKRRRFWKRSHTNGDDTMARRKRKRYWKMLSNGNKEDRIILRKLRKDSLIALFGAVVIMVMYVLTDDEFEEEDDDVRIELIEGSLNCLEGVKEMVERELGPKSGISKRALALLQDIPDSDDEDVLSTPEFFASDYWTFSSLMALSVDMRMKWVLTQVGKMQC